MEEYKSNSHKSRQNQNDDIPEKRVEKVVSGSVKSKKKNGLQKITNVFVPEDVDDVKSYIFEDIVVPAVKDIILDAVRAFLGVSGNSRGGRSSTSSKISYRKYYDDRDRRDSGNVSRTRTGYDYDDIILESRGEAEDVLERMDELIATYQVVSVADFYDLVGVSGNYTDNKYGWTDIRNASVIRVRDGYMIKTSEGITVELGGIFMYESDDKMVSHPSHYQSETGLEVIDVIEAFTFDLKGIEATDTGNIIKYACRWKNKNGIQDLKKIMWYTQHLIDHLEKKEKIEEENN